MKVLPLFAGMLCMITLTGCGALGGASNLLSTPLNLIKGMGQAVGRTIGTVSHNDAGATQTGPADIEMRAKQVESRGDYSRLASQQHGDVPIGKTAAR